MNKKYLLTLTLASCCIFTSCASKAGTGAVGGAGVGALAGGLGWGPQGAVIGAGVGAVGGALIGQSLDNADRNRMNRDTRRKYDRRQQLTKHEIIQLSKRDKYTDEQIAGIIRHTKSKFYITKNDYKELRKQGLSKKLISYMAGTTERYKGDD